MISIDGTDISSVTIDGESVQEITIDGTVAWTASRFTVEATIPNATASITFYEDTTGDGVADNSQTFALSDGTNNLSEDSFDLSAGNEMWYRLEADNSSVTDGATIDYIEVKY